MNRIGIVLFACAVAVAADEPLRTPGEQVLHALRGALGRSDDAAAVALLREVGGLVRYPASPKEAAALLKVAGEASKSKRVPVVIAALGALGDTRAAAAAVHVEPFLRAAKPAPGEEKIMVAAVRAAGRLRASVAIPALIKLASKSPDVTIADQSFGALGEFCGADDALRKNVTNKVLAACQLLSRKRSKWNRLRAPGLRALQRLTGRKLNTVTQFTDWWRHAKTLKHPFG